MSSSWMTGLVCTEYLEVKISVGAGNRRRTGLNAPRLCASVKTTPVTTCAPSSSPETTSVEMPSLMPVLICTACSFASGPSFFST